MVTEAARHSQRLFFALVPDDRVREAIRRATRDVVEQCGGRPTDPRNLHITVAFLGNLDPGQAQDAATAAPVESRPFDLELGTYTRRRDMLWLEPTSVPDALLELEQRLWERLAERGFSREERPFRPHLTLARKVKRADPGQVKIRWPVRELSLVESVGGEKGKEYVQLESWPL